MSANKAKNTRPEVLLRQALWREGMRGYRLHYKSVPGRPDIAFVKHKLAIFVNGCFWHRCPHCNYTLPKTNTPFWQNKFHKNVERDQKKVSQLEALGWTVLTIWECELKGDTTKAVEKISRALP
jgi:DNA mismatch endonuclease (patch repair protein)